MKKKFSKKFLNIKKLKKLTQKKTLFINYNLNNLEKIFLFVII